MKLTRTFFILTFILCIATCLRALNVTDNTPLAIGSLILAITSLVGVLYTSELIKLRA